MKAIGITIFLIFIVGIELLLDKSRREKIEEEINFIGGNVINIERRNLFTGRGPFFIEGKGETVYKIEYVVDGVLKEGWVKFAGLFGVDWRL